MGKMHFVKPQLARPWTKRRDYALIDMPGFTMEPKLDGHRVSAVITSSKVILLSRTGKRIQPIPWLEVWLKRQILAGTYIDGELVAAGGSSNNVSSLRAHNPEQLAFVAFDLLWDHGEDIRHRQWNVRRRQLEQLSTMAFDWPITGDLEPSRYYTIDSRRQSDTVPPSARQATQDAWIHQGFEGVVFKDIFAPYRPNSRSSWVKWKWTMRANVIVTDADSQPSKWRVRPGHVGTDGVFYPDGQHTEPWELGYTGLSYGYGPVQALDPSATPGRLVNVPRVGPCVRVGSLGITGEPAQMQQYVGKVADCKCWGAYESGALRHPQAEKFTDWDGTPILPPDPTMESVT